jgi:hypothetical protein
MLIQQRQNLPSDLIIHRALLGWGRVDGFSRASHEMHGSEMLALIWITSVPRRFLDSLADRRR